MKKYILLLIIPFLSLSQVNYETQIQPILNANCIECHQGNAGYFGGLALTSYEELMEGGYTEVGITFINIVLKSNTMLVLLSETVF